MRHCGVAVKGGRAYERIGDPFSLRVLAGQGPRTVRRLVRSSTGRVYFTRVRVNECVRLSIDAALEAVPGSFNLTASELAEAWALHLYPERREFQLAPLNAYRLPEAVRVSFCTGGAGRGAAARLWLRCPECGRRCAHVYTSPWDEQGEELAGEWLVGCRTCLGLTDESSQKHKTLSWVGAVLGHRPYPQDPTGKYRARAKGIARGRAVEILDRSVRRTLRGLAG